MTSANNGDVNRQSLPVEGRGERPPLPHESDEAIRTLLRQLVVDVCHLTPDELDDERPLAEYGLQSRDAVGISGRLETALNRSLPATLLWENPTIDQLVRSLTTEGPEAKACESASSDQAAAAPETPADGADDLIAVVGAGCRLPGGINGPDEFWCSLLGERDMIGQVPPDRWQDFDDGSAGTAALLASTTRWGAFLEDIQGFDADFFGITPREAELMDPQQRLLLEVTWEALEHARIAPPAVRGTATGVFVGLSSLDYGHLTTADLTRVTAYTSTGAAGSIAANRLSYQLDVHGPSMTVDTACSSSLVAVHMACRSLRSGESTMALAAGANLVLSPMVTANFDLAGALSPDGRCKPFSASADGIARGEGCGVVVLKRLADARSDGDRILAVIRGTSVNSDGRSAGLMAPNPVAQGSLLRAAVQDAQVKAVEIDYVETHGTGTLLGDPIEAVALGTVMGRGRDADRPLLIGSVKSNVGHLEGAAGIVGLIKTVLSLHHGWIPASLHFDKPNPHIDFAASRLRVVTEATRWPAGRDRSGLAGVSAFGFGGTNAHAILEQAPPDELVEAPGRRSVEEAADEARTSVLFVSARSAARVSDTAAGLAEWLGTADGQAASLEDVAHSLAHRLGGPATAAVVARGRDGLAAGLLALAQGQPLRGVVPAQQRDGRSREKGPVFVFSGYGSQWEGMGRGLLDDDTAFAAAVEALDPLFVSSTGCSLADLIRGAEASAGVDRTQPLLYGMQVALARTWQAYGIEPSAVIGHSMGEVSAAVVAGALDAGDGLRVILRRSSLLAEIDGTGAGAMAAVELPEDVRPAVLARYPGVEIAVHASPQRCTLTGPSEAVTRLAEELDAAGNSANLLNVGGAGHSPTVDPILPSLRTSLAELSPHSPTVPWYGTVADDPRTPVHADAAYWCSNARQPVRLQQAVAAAAEDGHRTFLEISPHPVAGVPVRETLEADVPDTVRVLATLRREGDEALDLRTSMAALHLAGFNVRTDVVRPPGRRITLPSPPWRRVRHWINKPEQAGRLPRGGHPLLGLRIDVPGTDRILWQGDVGTSGWNRTARHIHGTRVLTLSVCADMMLSAVLDAAVTPAPGDIALEALTMHRWLPLASSTPVTTSWEPLGDGGATVELHTRSAAGTWLCHASATVASPDVVPSHPTAKLPAEAGVLPSAAHSSADGANVSGRAVPSGVLDVCLHAPTAPQADSPGAVDGSGGDEQPQSDSVAVPASVASLRVALGSDSSWSALPVLCGPRRLDAPEPGGRAPEALWDVRVDSPDGRPVVEAQGILMRSPDPGELPKLLEEMTYEVQWVKAPIAALSESGPAHWLLMTVGPEETAGRGNRYVPSVSSDLQDRGHQVKVSHYDERTTDALLTGWYEEVGSDPAAVVILLTDADADASGSGCWAVSAAADVARHLAASGHAAQPRLWLLTDGALSVTPGETGDPDRAALQGLVRVMALEQPQLRATLVDIDRVPDSSEKLVEELLANGDDDQVAWRGDTRLAARLVPTDLSDHPVRTRMARQDGSYIITGGLGGLGLATAQRLAQLGAGHVVLNGRRSPSAKTQSVLKELRDLGTAVTVVQGDIAEPHVADRLVEAAVALGHSLRGVAHAAGVLHDGVISQVGPGDIETVFRPKVAGARHLERATEGQGLDWWLLFSSAAAMLGSPGQSAYAAANAWLDGQASRRQARGLPATSIAWGPWAGVGAAPEISAMGLETITASDGLDALQLVLARGPAHTGMVRLDPRKITDSFPGLEGIPYYSRLPFPDGPGDEWIGLKDLGNLDDAQAAAVVFQRVSQQVAAVMGHVPEVLDATLPLTELGLDSLMAVRIRNALKQDFAIVLPPTVLLRGASLTDLVDILLKSLERSGPAAPDAPSTPWEPETEELTIARKPRDLPLPTTLDPRDPSERLVAGVWESVLGRKPASVHQELASEGDDSGIARSLAAGIRERLGGETPGVDWGQITGHSTVAAIGDLIRPVVNGDGQSPVRVLCEPVGRTSGHPLFVFHPAGGPTSVYRPLVQLLAADQSVYGFDRIDTITTMEDKAAHYLGLMRDIQPAGPYRLLGWSFGGCLAYEVACQLQDLDEQAEFVGLIDTILPAALPGLDSKDILIERFRRFAEYIQNTYGRSLPLSYEDLADLPEEEHIDVVMGMVAKAGLDMTPGIMEHQRTSYIDARVGERYRPRPYRGKVVLYRAQEAHQLTTTLDPRYLRDEADLGWEPLCSSGLTVVPIPGDHLSMIDPPHVSAIAHHLARALSSAL